MDPEIIELHKQAAKLHGDLKGVVDTLPNPIVRALAKGMIERFHELVSLLIKKVEKNGR